MKMVELPPYLILCFLNDWISIKENCLLNSAMCDNNEREQLTRICYLKANIVENIHALDTFQFLNLSIGN